MTGKDAIRGQIVEAARKRFKHYGYGKTTMAELAADCNMSPGNLYRYFPSKLDIAEAIADEASDEILAQLRVIAEQHDRGPTDRLVDYFFASLRLSYQKLDEARNIVELAQVISRERPQFANRELAHERTILCKLLEAGNAAGEFKVADAHRCAEMLQCATMKYRYPQLWSQLSLSALERELAGVLQLIRWGLDTEPAAGCRTLTAAKLGEVPSSADSLTGAAL